MQAAMIDLRLLEELEAKNALEARVHSVFKTTINLEVEGFENLISLLHSSKSMQPNSIRLPALPKLEAKSRLKIFPAKALSEVAYLSQEEEPILYLQLEQFQSYSANLESPKDWCSAAELSSRLLQFAEQLKKSSKSSGVLPLVIKESGPISREAKWISPEFEQFKNSYLKALNSPANSAAEAWTEASTAVLALLGFGTGMTPFMDDFICGLLFARLVLRQAQAAGISYKDRSSRELKTAELKVKAESQEELEQKLAAEEIFISQIRQTARQKTNRISADLIKQAADGLASEILKKMLTALFDRCDGEVKTSLEELVKIGQSSGSDLAAGIYFALKTATLTGA